MVPSELRHLYYFLQMLLATQLEMEKMKVEQEKKKAIFVQETREKVLDCVCIVNYP